MYIPKLINHKIYNKYTEVSISIFDLELCDSHHPLEGMNSTVMETPLYIMILKL